MTDTSKTQERSTAITTGALDSEYPTDKEIEEIWTALETGDQQEVLNVLRKRREERAQRESQSGARPPGQATEKVP